MRSLRTLLTAVVAVLALSVTAGLASAWQHGAQHGGQSPSHLDVIAERLGLGEAQKQELAEPIEGVVAAVIEIHRLHETIAAELDEEQKSGFATALHEMMGGILHGHEGPRHHGGGAR